MSSATTSGLAESAAPLDMPSGRRRARPGPPLRSPTCRRRSGRSPSRRKPGTTARRLGELGAEAGRVLGGTSTVAPAARGPPVRRCRLDREPAAEAAGPALPRRRTDRRAAGDRRRPRAARPQARAVLPGEPRPRRLAPSNVPLVNPASAKARDRHGGAEPGARGQAAGEGPGLGTAHSGDGRRQRLRPGRQHRR